MYQLDGIQIVFIYAVGFLVLQYIGGIFVGFVKSPFDFSFGSILANSIPVFLLIGLQEYFRSTVLAKVEGHPVLEVSVTLLLAFFAISYNFSAYHTDSALGIFTLLGELILPSLANNFLLSYLTKYYSQFPSILYRVITECYFYWIPIIPDYGPYIDSVLKLLLPLLIFMHLNNLQVAKNFPEARPKKTLSDWCLQGVAIIFLVLVVSLTSGLFGYQAIAIVSNSMVPTFQRGDILIVKKLSETEKETLQVGDIIAYQNGTSIVIHRISRIESYSFGNIYFTKGDANESEDGYEIYPEAIVGTANYRLPFVGYPTVWLNEAWN